MVASKKRKRKSRRLPRAPRGRSNESYLYSADNLSKIVPSLKRFSKRKTLRKSEKATIRRREKQLLHIPHLEPLSPSQAKRLGRKKTFLPGVQAVQLRGIDTRKGDKFNVNRHGDIEVTKAGGDRWIYWALDRKTVRSHRGMCDAGAAVFNKTLPIEKVTELTEEAFAHYTIQQVHLWAHAGVVGDGFQSLKQFVGWVNEKWNQGRYISTRRLNEGGRYEVVSDPGQWINGIAFLVENPEYTKRRKELDAQTQANNKMDKPKRRKRRS